MSKINLKQGDCLKLMKKIPDKSIDMILADLPYGTTQCKWDTVIDFNKLWEQYNRIIKPNAAIVLFGTEPFTSQLVGSNLRGYREHLTWIKHRASNFANAKYMHMKYTEDIIVFGYHKPTFNRQMQPRTASRVEEGQHSNSKQWNKPSEVSFATKYEGQSWRKYDPKLKNPTDYLKFPGVVSNSKERTKHPTQKPVKLLEYLIKTYTNKGELVLDNTMGSGSTGVAAVNLNRDFIGYELEQDYFDIATDRINKAIKDHE